MMGVANGAFITNAVANMTSVTVDGVEVVTGGPFRHVGGRRLVVLPGARHRHEGARSAPSTTASG